MFSKTITTEDPIYEAVLSFKNNNYSMKGDFYGRTYNYVHAIVFDVIPDEQAVAGIITGVYEMIYNYIGTLDDPQMFYVWAGSIATDAAFSYVYNNSPEFLDAKVDYSYGSAESVTDYAGQDGEVFVPLAALKNGECIEELFKYIEGLPVTARIIKQKYYFENMSISEIAASMSINPDEVRSNIAYIKSVVKYAVMKYGGASTGTGRGDNVNTLGAIWYIFSGSTEGLISGELTGRLYVAGAPQPAEPQGIFDEQTMSEFSGDVGMIDTDDMDDVSGSTGMDEAAGTENGAPKSFLSTTAGKVAIGVIAVVVTVGVGVGTYAIMRNFGSNKDNTTTEAATEAASATDTETTTEAAKLTDREKLQKYYEDTVVKEDGMMETEVTGKVDVTWDVAKDGRVVNSEPWFNSKGILNYRKADFHYYGSN